jgi:hypothetical protein
MDIHEEFWAVVIAGMAESSYAIAKAGALALNKTRLSYSAIETLAFQLMLQLQVLEARGYTLLFWQASAILVVPWQGQRLYLLDDLSQLVPLAKNNAKQLVLVYPTVYPLPAECCAPELLTLDRLPFQTERSASYYSLALLCLQLLDLSLEKIEGTKLFYFLERCMHKDPRQRLLLYL